MDRVVELGAVITRLRGELRAHERELAALLATIPVTPSPSGEKKRATKAKAGTKRRAGAKRKPARGKVGHESGSTTGKILRLLRDNPKDVFDAAEVAHHLGAKVDSVRTMLKRLVESGDIHKTGRGAFRA